MSGTFHTEFDEPPEVLWQWLSRPGAIYRLIPPWQPMTVISQATSLRDGVAELRVAGVPWRAEHQADGYQSGRQFVDELTSFPLRLASPWRHTHLIEPRGSGTMMTDTVQCRVPERLLRNTFRYRARQIRDDLAAHRAAAARRGTDTPMTIAVTGASGLIGRQLCALLTTGGHRVIELVRPGRAAPLDPAIEREWNPAAPAAELLDGVDAVVHLAGAPIAGRFTERHKQQVLDSRVGPTRELARAAVKAGVATFLSASAIGYYGADRGDQPLTENADAGTGFVADVVAQWEADSIEVANQMRVVHVRTGIVLTPDGGFLRPLRPLFAAGLGGPLGSGEQWLSWIAIDDMVQVYLRLLTDPAIVGPVNAAAPHPVRYREFARTFGSVLHRPTIVPTPAFGPRLLLGSEGAEQLALASQRVVPQVLTDAGEPFRFPTLTAALQHLFGADPR